MRGVAGLLPGRRRRTAEDERSAADVISAVPEQEFPYGRQPECGPDTAAFRRLGATFTPHPAPETKPIPVAEVPDEVTVLEKVLDGLQNLDWEALDAARERHATYAARGRAPFGDYMERTFRHPALRHPHRGGLNHARVVTLAYPVPGQVADDGDYADVMRRLNQITGTQGWTPRRALPSGGAL